MGAAPVARDKLDAIGIDPICERVANCDFLEDIAKDCDVSRHALSLWLQSGDNSDMYTRAREAQADKMADDIIKISDDSSRDTYTDEQGNVRTDQEVVARSRLRVDSRKWLAAKMLPKRYGERLGVDLDATVKLLAAQMTDEDLAEIAMLKK